MVGRLRYLHHHQNSRDRAVLAGGVLINSFSLYPGDPTPIGFVTVALYLLAAWYCSRAARADPGSRRIWAGISIAMVLLGINKQLDLQTVLTDFGRQMAYSEHWYDSRRAVQKIFVILLGLSAAIGAVFLMRRLNRRSNSLRIAGLGTLLLMAFVVIRAASFHHVDRFLGTRSFGFPWNTWLEVGGIMTIFAGAFSATRKARAGPR